MASKIKLSNANGKIVTIENNDSNMSDVTLNGASITKKVDTLANMRAMNELPETVWCSGYHSKNDGAFGSHFYRLKGLKTTETDNSGTVIIVSVGSSDYVYELQCEGAVNVKWFGAKGDGVTDDTNAIQSAINFYRGKTIFLPSGEYLTSNELVIPYAGGSSTELIGEQKSSTTIHLVTATDSAVLRLSASYCNVSKIRFTSDSITNTGVRIAPEDEDQVVTLVGQSYNTIEDCNFIGTLGYGIYLMTGPKVGGADSHCFHNKIIRNNFNTNCNVGVYLTDGNSVGSSTSNRNWIIENYFSGNMNCGIYNAGADTTYIQSNSFEGIDYGTSPLVSPTAIRIDNISPISSLSNQSISILDNRFEGCTIDIDNDNERTQILGGNHNRTKCNFLEEGKKDPLIVIGGYDYTLSTFKLAGYKYQTNNQENIPNGMVLDNGLYLTKDSSKLSDYKNNSFTPFVIDNSNSEAKGQTYSIRVGRYTLIGNRCFIDVRIRTSSVGTLTATDSIRIGGLPYLSKNISDYQASLACGKAQLLNLAGNYGISGIITQNANYIYISVFDGAGGSSNLLVSEWSEDGDITLSGSYEIA